jgi:hypothetical protein
MRKRASDVEKRRVEEQRKRWRGGGEKMKKNERKNRKNTNSAYRNQCSGGVGGGQHTSRFRRNGRGQRPRRLAGKVPQDNQDREGELDEELKKSLFAQSARGYHQRLWRIGDTVTKIMRRALIGFCGARLPLR